MLKRRIIVGGWSSVYGQSAFDIVDVAAALTSLTTADVVDEDYLTAVGFHEAPTASRPLKIQFLSLREYADRPLQYTPGQSLTAVPLPVGYYTADAAHMLIWPDGFFAYDHHGNSPRPGRLSHYLRRKLQRYVTFETYYDPHVVNQLQDIRGQMRTVEFGMADPDRVNQDRGAFGSLVPAVWGERTPSISVKIGMGRHRARNTYLDGAIEEEVLRIAESADQLVDTLIIAGRSRSTGRMTRLNLLKETLGEDVEISPAVADSSLPDPDHAFTEIQRIFNNLRESGALDTAVHARAIRS
jgi:hypothetical protein